MDCHGSKLPGAPAESLRVQLVASPAGHALLSRGADDISAAFPDALPPPGLHAVLDSTVESLQQTYCFPPSVRRYWTADR